MDRKPDVLALLSAREDLKPDEWVPKIVAGRESTHDRFPLRARPKDEDHVEPVGLVRASLDGGHVIAQLGDDPRGLVVDDPADQRCGGRRSPRGSLSCANAAGPCGGRGPAALVMRWM